MLEQLASNGSRQEKVGFGIVDVLRPKTEFFGLIPNCTSTVHAKSRFPGWVYFSLPLEIRGFSRHTDFCGLAIRRPGAFENFYAD